VTEAAVTTVVSVGDCASVAGEVSSTTLERAHLHDAATALAELARRHHLVVTYGTAPHLELLLGLGPDRWLDPQFDVIAAESEAAIGYLLAQELRNRLPQERVALLLTQVRVDPADPEFLHPTARLGSLVDAQHARDRAASRRWLFEAEAGGWRRLVPSPEPLAVVEADTVTVLLSAGVVVVCSGGGGIPVVADRNGDLRGVAAVVSQELAASVLARQIAADQLVLLDAGDYGAAPAHGDEFARVRVCTAREQEGALDRPGRDRLEAACRFVEATGHPAMVGPLQRARAVLDGDIGTTVVPG
jgi:carbamate kinase